MESIQWGRWEEALTWRVIRLKFEEGKGRETRKGNRVPCRKSSFCKERPLEGGAGPTGKAVQQRVLKAGRQGTTGFEDQPKTSSRQTCSPSQLPVLTLKKKKNKIKRLL